MSPAAVALAAMGVAAVVIGVWLPALGASFQFDDFLVVVKDPRVQSLAAWWHSMPAIRPVLRASYALNHEFGADVRGFRAVNVAIHAANAALVLLMLRRLALRLGYGAAAALAIAAIAALVFALHPVQTEAVTYVTGRSSSLVALFSLAAMLAWLASFDPPPTDGSAAGYRARSTRLRLLALALGACAVGVKESALVLPVALLLWAWMVPPEGAGAERVRARQYASIAACAAVAALAAAALWIATPYPDLIRAALARRDPWENLLTQAHAVPYLLGHLLDPSALNADPDLRPVTALDGPTAIRLALIVVTLGAAVALRRRAPGVTFGVLWCALWLLPTNSLFAREDLANDRQLYAAMIGPAWLVGLAIVRGAGMIASRAGDRTAIAGAAPIALALCGALAAATLERNRVYATEVSFWEDAARKSPGKARTLGNLGYAYALACRDGEALAAFDRALTLDPHDFRAAANRRFLSRGDLFAPGERACDAADRR